MSVAHKGSTCEGILEMIDFFSQVMHPELIEEYGYRYIHEILGLEASAIYMVKEPRALYLAQFIGLDCLPGTLEINRSFEDLATKVGVVLFEELHIYFENDSAFEFANFLMPLVVADQLIGFIVASRPKTWQYEDYTFAEAAKKMVNLAFGTGLQMTENKKFRELMDRRIYDQMLLSHLSKLLLQHLDETELIQAAVEGIRELTASSQTGFFLKSEYSNVLELVHYSDLKHFNRLIGHMAIQGEVPLLKLTFSLDEPEDYRLLLAYFGNDGLEMLRKVGASRIVFLSDKEIIGFVTLGETVAGERLSEVVMPLVESIMGSVRIGLENAKQFKLLNRQKQELSQSLKAMEAISKAINNLSGAADLNELAELLLMNFVFQLGVASGAVYFKDEHHGYKMAACYGMTQIEEQVVTEVNLSEQCLAELRTGWLTGYEANAINLYLIDNACELEALFGDKTFLMTGIWPKSLEESTYPECIFIGFELEKVFSQFEKYFTEALIQGVSPLISLLKTKYEKCLTYQSYSV